MKKCDQCGKEPALIHLEGVGDFCLSCHNKRMAELNGIDPTTFVYPRKAAFTDKDGDLHFFCLSHMFFGSMIQWKANEEGGDYEIIMYADADESPEHQVNDFYQKIADTLWNRTMSKLESPWGATNMLKDHGNIDITFSPEREEVSLVIDGKPISLEELGKMLETYEGFTMQYQIRDKGEDVVKEKELLVPVEFTKEALLKELKEVIYTFSEANRIDEVQFVSYERVPDLSDRIFSLIDKLKYWYKNGSREDAASCGEEMIQVLQKVETDDDWFPEYEIGLVKKLIHS